MLFLKFFLILRAKAAEKAFSLSGRFSDEVVVYFFPPQEGKAHRERQNEDKNFFMGHSRFSFLVRKK